MLKNACVFAVSMSLCGAAMAADVAAGKKKYEEMCSQCHEKTDSAGKSAALVESRIKEVVTGKFKHKKKLKLTDAEIADLAAFWVSP